MNYLPISYCFLLISFLLFVGIFHPIAEMNQDLGRHIVTGSIILQNWNVPQTNLFSYTYPDFPFVNTHWLSEVIFALLFKTFSFPGFAVMSIALIFFSFIPLVIYSWKRSKNIPAILIVSFLYINVLYERLLIRPELFSFLFTSLFILILYKNREKFTRFIFILPLFQLFWVNLHIYFFIGIVLCGLFFVDNLICQRKKILNFVKGKGSLPFSTIIIGLVTGGVFLVSFANPNGWQGALYPLFVMQNYGYPIEENQNIWFLWNYSQKTTILFFVFSLLLLFLSLFLVRKKTKPIDWLLAITFSLLSYTSIRNFPLFVFTTFIPATLAFSTVSKPFVNKIVQKKPYIIPLFLVAITAFFLYSGYQITQKKGFGYGVEEHGKDALDFFTEQKLTGPLFNNFDIGSYIDYRLYPKEKVFVDGRPEAYPASFFKNIYIPMQEDEKLFERYSKKYNFATIIFSHADQTPWARSFLQSILKSKHWLPIYLDDTFIILVQNTKENEALIKKYKVTEDTPSYQLQDNSLFSFAKLIRFYEIAGWEKPQEVLYQKLLSTYPNSCVALANLSRLLAERNDPGTSAFSSRLSTCQ